MKQLLSLIVIPLVTLVYASNSAALFGPSSYKECVLENINVKLPARAVVDLEIKCRTAFPDKSTSFFTPDTAAQCYEKHKQLASSRVAAKAIYRACNDHNYRRSQIPSKPAK
jgi:hypothetical protein